MTDDPRRDVAERLDSQCTCPNKGSGCLYCKAARLIRDPSEEYEDGLARIHPDYLRHLRKLEKRAIERGEASPTDWEREPSEGREPDAWMVRGILNGYELREMCYDFGAAVQIAEYRKRKRQDVRIIPVYFGTPSDSPEREGRCEHRDSRVAYYWGRRCTLDRGHKGGHVYSFAAEPAESEVPVHVSEHGVPSVKPGDILASEKGREAVRKTAGIGKGAAPSPEGVEDRIPLRIVENVLAEHSIFTPARQAIMADFRTWLARTTEPPEADTRTTRQGEQR